MKPSFKQIEEFWRQVESGRITMPRLQQFLEGKSGESLTVVVDYSQPIAEMVRAGKYDYVNSDITDKRFPKKQNSGAVETSPDLVHLNKVVSTDEALRELNARGLRPATLEELLAFGAAYPEEQRKFSIVGLGSSWLDPLGHRRVPVLWGNSSGRDLSLYWREDDWNSGYRFLAIRK